MAENDLVITSDADVRVTPDYLRSMVQTLKNPHVGLASCVYLGTTDGGFSAQLDAVGKSVEMTSGVLVADMLEGTKLRWARRWPYGGRVSRTWVVSMNWDSFMRMILSWEIDWQRRARA